MEEKTTGEVAETEKSVTLGPEHISITNQLASAARLVKKIQKMEERNNRKNRLVIKSKKKRRALAKVQRKSRKVNR